MGKVVSSGLHKLGDLFGESVFDFSQQLQRFRMQFDLLEREYLEIEQRVNEKGTAWCLIGIEIIATLFGLGYLTFLGLGSRASSDRGVAIMTLLILVGGTAVALLTYNKMISRPRIKHDELSKERERLRSDGQQLIERYAQSITDRLRALAAKRSEVGRIAQRGDAAWLFYCPSYSVMLDILAEEMMLLNTVDCRDVQISYREVERRAVSAGATQSNMRNSLAGAAIGSLVFGEAGMIAGAVIGSAGERKHTMETVERHVGNHVVDLYTRLQQHPVVTLEFGENETVAKEFYAVMAAAVRGQNQK